MIKELTKEKHLKYILNDLQDYANGKFVSPLELVDSECELLLNYITNLQKENTNLKKLCDKYEEEHKTTFETWKTVIARNEKAVEYIKKDTRWFDSEYAKIYGTLCDCEGAKGDRLEVLVNPTNLLNILQGGDE